MAPEVASTKPVQKSLWLAQAPRLEPQSTSAARAEVAVVGAGFTGLLTALELQARGKNVMLLDPRGVGTGTSGHTTGKVTSQHAVIYSHVARSHGAEGARTYAEANQWAIEAYAGLIDKLGIDCGFIRKTAWIYTESDSETETLAEEVRAAVGAGIDAAFDPPPLHFVQQRGVAFPNQAQFHPGKFLHGAGEAFLAAGGPFRRERVKSVEGGAPCKLTTASGKVLADSVVLATLYPLGDHTLFASRMIPNQHHGMAFEVEDAPLEGMFIRSERPTYSLRWAEEEGGLLVAIGPSHRLGEVEGDPYADITAYVSQRFRVRKERYRWSAHDQHSADMVPYIGRYDLAGPNVYTATGYRAWGITHAMVAARLIADGIEGVDNPWASLYSPARLKPVETAKTAAKQAISSVKHLVVERLRGQKDFEAMAPGSGQRFTVEGKHYGAYKDPGGATHIVSATCPHMGCMLSWNQHDQTWDCPCHGSRFDPQGEVLYGPAASGIALRNGEEK